MSRNNKIKEILAAWNYKSNPDPCNSVYLGSMEKGSILRGLGSTYGSDKTIEEVLADASNAQIGRAHRGALFVIAYMKGEDKIPPGLYEAEQIAVGADQYGNFTIEFKISKGKYKGRVISR